MGRFQQWHYRLAQPLSQFLSWKVLLQGIDNPVFMPFWHAVSDEPLPFIQGLYPQIDRDQFRQSLDLLLQHFYPLSLEALYVNPKPPKRLGRYPAFFSFDDGLEVCAREIAPILLEKGIPATFFINSAFVEDAALFGRYKERLQDAHYQRPVYMSHAQLKELTEAGFSLGGHSHSHPAFDQLSWQDAQQEVRQSMDFIQQHFPQKVKAFAFPFTDSGLSMEFLLALKSEGLVDISFGTAGLKQDPIPHHFQRFPMEGSTVSAETLVKSEFLLYQLKRILDKHRIVRS
jgi:peptidoglycan/xylan/chitin deacetylase (PgdA/CDA1 family)